MLRIMIALEFYGKSFINQKECTYDVYNVLLIGLWPLFISELFLWNNLKIETNLIW